MKAIKISLIIIVCAAVFVGAWYFFAGQIKSPDPSTGSGVNRWVQDRETDIGHINRRPDSVFCGQAFREVEGNIQYDHQGGNLGSDLTANDEMRDSLLTQLYNTYTNKFVKQAHYVFDQHEWQESSLQFIRNEISYLRQSGQISSNSSVEEKFKEFDKIFVTYDRINALINHCRNYSFTDYAPNASYPTGDVRTLVQTASGYLAADLENEYVSNCSRLRQDLRQVGAVLYGRHVAYLQAKIQHNSRRFAEFVDFGSYSTEIYRELMGDLNMFDNNLYKIDQDSFDAQKSAFLQAVENDNTAAYQFYSNE